MILCKQVIGKLRDNMFKSRWKMIKLELYGDGGMSWEKKSYIKTIVCIKH